MMKYMLCVLCLLLGTQAAAQDISKDLKLSDTNGRAAQPYDPSKNVLDLVQAAIKRQDDLREAQDKLNSAHDDTLKQLAAAESRRVDEQMALRAFYDEKLREAEAKRIDAIRLVDVNAVSEDRRRTGEQAVALATQVAQSADTVRALVASTKTSTDLSVTQVTQALSQRITTLEQAGYQQAGKTAISDPALIALNAKVDALVTARTDTVGRDTGRSDVTGWIVAGVVVLIGFLQLVVNFMRGRPTTSRRG